MTILKELYTAQQAYHGAVKEVLLKASAEDNIAEIETRLEEVVEVLVATSRMGLIDPSKHQSITMAVLAMLQNNVRRLQGDDGLPVVPASPSVLPDEGVTIDDDGELPIGWCCRNVPRGRYHATHVLAVIRDPFTDVKFTKYSVKSENGAGRHTKQHCTDLNELLEGKPLMTIHTEVGFLIGIDVSTNQTSVKIRPLWLSGTRRVCLSAVTITVNLTASNVGLLPSVVPY